MLRLTGGARQSAPAMVVALTAVVGAGLAVAACVVSDGGSMKVGSPPYVQGSGTLATETRPLDAFHALSASQGIEVSVSNGGSYAASVTADDNLLEHVSTEVSDGTLFVAVEGNIDTWHPLQVDVTMASPVDAITADAGATVDCEDLQPGSLEVRATSGATVRGGGRATSLDLTADAGATVDLRNVEAEQARVDVSTGSTVHVQVTQAVRGSCSVGSTLRLHGTPATVDVQTDASSTVRE